MDSKRLCAIPGIQAPARHAGRIQREVHEQSKGPARRKLRDARLALAGDLPQFLSPRKPVAFHGDTLMRRITDRMNGMHSIVEHPLLESGISAETPVALETEAGEILRGLRAFPKT